MGGISTKYTATNENNIIPLPELPKLTQDQYQLSSNVINYEEPKILTNEEILNGINSDIVLKRIINKEKQYYVYSGKEMNDSLHNLLQQIQLNILANNYNEKNKQILKKLLKEANNKQLELKDTKEANLADYRRIELIQSEIKQKNKTILFVIIISVLLSVLLIISSIFLKSNINFTIPFRLPRR